MLKDMDKKLSVAPMMDWTDRHCRYLHRLISRRVLLYTEMITAAAVLHGDPARLLAYHACEHPLALQLGGADPRDLGAATQIAAQCGFDEVNLNVGCPSDRVQSGAFGASLMKNPELVADCAAAMIAASGDMKITVKCRIGVDDQNPQDVLPAFLDRVSGAGVRAFSIHARKAWLDGVSPKKNREVPPLDHSLVVKMKEAFPALEIVINGGIGSLDEAEALLAQGLDGVMIGRAAYQRPMDVLSEADHRIFGEPRRNISPESIAREMLPYIDDHLAKGGRLAHITRHMLGLFQGQSGARRWRQILSEGAHRSGAGSDLVEAALGAVATIQGLHNDA